MPSLRTASLGHRTGFTLVDLVVTVLIMAILAAVTGPRFAITLHRTRTQSAAERVATDLNYARQKAISLSSTIEVQFTIASDRYTIPDLPGLNHKDETYVVELDEAPYQALLESASLGGDANVVFDRFGVPDSGGVITIAAGGLKQTITLDPDSGRASVP